ncbi:radical S-adenosyl methionine domain-containing protein 1 [Boothiomyces sp. JEL0838]|nr:radical S-adenosyl methionine domain-containing protein 1 [Boothiomyces sp. JEL0838]
MTDCLIKELKHDLGNYKITSVYFGGGTPSLAEPSLVSSTLEYIRNHSNSSDMEITMEANPTGFEISKLKLFKDAGVNRLSLGIQSLDDRMLKLMNRDHSVKDALKAIDLARSHFDNVSLDFIWGRPGQSLKGWEEELLQVFKFGANHLSLYQLTVERGTALFKQVKNKEIQPPSDDDLADMFELTRTLAADNGYVQYEVSSFAKDGIKENQSQHNKNYWEGNDYIGVGPGAHGLLHMENKRFRTYREYILTSLRTAKGANLEVFAAIAENNFESYLNLESLDQLSEMGYLDIAYSSGTIQSIRPTYSGMAVADALVQKLLV